MQILSIDSNMITRPITLHKDPAAYVAKVHIALINC